MAVFRVEKTKDFTVMSNHHLRNTELSLKAKGLLSLMLSLPEDWDYTTKGLAHICRDGVDSITTALKELERHRYLTRQRLRYGNGQLGDIEYTIHEKPANAEKQVYPPKRENPRQVNPRQAKPGQAKPEQGKPGQGNPAQLNTDPLNTERSKTDGLNTYQSICPAGPEATGRPDGMDRMDMAGAYREIIKENIEYGIMVSRYGAERVDETVELMLETMLSRRPFIRIAGDDFPREVVRSRFLKINSGHLEYVFDCIDRNTTKVGNIKAYLLAALYNAPATMLPYGHYTVHQVSGEEGKAFIPDFTVFINENGFTYSYILNNRTITARLKVEKCDAETGNIIPMTGTGFQIKDLSTGEFVTQEIYYPNPETLDTFYVSDEGWLMLPEPLHTGDYELYEVAAPYGYVLSSEPVPFTIDGSEAVATVTQHNMSQKGQLAITKSGEVFASVQENEGLYQPMYVVMGLPGAVYDVIADEDIYTGDGTLRAAKDTVVEILTTGDDGTAISGLLYLGRYRLEERKAPVGMVLNTEPEYAELTYAGETVEVTRTEKGLYDER